MVHGDPARLPLLLVAPIRLDPLAAAGVPVWIDTRVRIAANLATKADDRTPRSYLPPAAHVALFHLIYQVEIRYRQLLDHNPARLQGQ